MRPSLRVLLVIVLLALAPPSDARWRPWQPLDAPHDGYHLAGRGGDIGQDVAAANVRRATGGRVLSVRKGNGTYRVKVLLPGGRVRTVPVDSRTGRLLD